MPLQLHAGRQHSRQYWGRRQPPRDKGGGTIFVEQLQRLAAHRRLETMEAGGVCLWLCQVRNEAALNRCRHLSEHDGDGPRERLQGGDGRVCVGHRHI